MTISSPTPSSIPAPTFVGGAGRSGIKFARAILNAHPNIGISHELKLTPHLVKVWARPYHLRDHSSEFFDAKDKDSIFRNIISYFLDGVKEQYGTLQVREKTPNNALVFPHLNHLFPESPHSTRQKSGGSKEVNGPGVGQYRPRVTRDLLPTPFAMRVRTLGHKRSLGSSGGHCARLKFVGRFTSALVRLTTTNLWKIALALKAGVQLESNYRRIQRFFSDYDMDFTMLGRLLTRLVPQRPAYVVVHDPTEWQARRPSISWWWGSPIEEWPSR
jgi:hypothetical protein